MPSKPLEVEREEWKALVEADALHRLPTEALIASIKYLAARLLQLTDDPVQARIADLNRRITAVERAVGILGE